MRLHVHVQCVYGTCSNPTYWLLSVGFCMDKTTLLIIVETQKRTVMRTHVQCSSHNIWSMILVLDVSQSSLYQIHFASVWVGERLQTCSWEEGITEWRKLFTGTEQGGWEGGENERRRVERERRELEGGREEGRARKNSYEVRTVAICVCIIPCFLFILIIFRNPRALPRMCWQRLENTPTTLNWLSLTKYTHAHTHTHTQLTLSSPLSRSVRHYVTRKCMRTFFVVWFSSMKKLSPDRSWYTS